MGSREDDWYWDGQKIWDVWGCEECQAMNDIEENECCECGTERDVF